MAPLLYLFFLQNTLLQIGPFLFQVHFCGKILVKPYAISILSVNDNKDIDIFYNYSTSPEIQHFYSD